MTTTMTLRPLILSLLVLPSFLAFGQEDTLRVQTLTFDSITTRRGWFEFPDASNTYRKALVKYTLKCDAQTTADQFACGEWDYLTYNFIYHHTGVMDSTALVHPTFKVNVDAPDSAELTAIAPFDSYQRWSRFRTIDQVMTESDHAVGVGNAADAGTFAPGTGGVRSQFVFTATELSAAGLQAGSIERLRFEVTASGNALDRLVIRMKHLSSPLGDSFVGSGLETVYDHAYAFAASGTSTIDLLAPFVWDGTSDILVDIASEGPLAGPAVEATSGMAGLRDADRDGYLMVDNDRLGVDPAPMAAVDNAITIMFWAYGGDILPVNNSVLEAVNAQGQRVLNIHLPWSNSNVYWDAGQDGSGYDRINKLAAPQDILGQWNHWTFTKNTASGAMRIYLNGTLWHTGTGKTRSMAGITAINLGAGITGGNNYPGALDQVAIFRTELGASTIMAWKDRAIDATHPNYADLLYDLRFDEAADEFVLVNTIDPANTAYPLGTVQRGYHSATALGRSTTAISDRPDITFVQGMYQTQLDSTIATQARVKSMLSLERFQVVDHEAIPTDTLFGWSAGDLLTFDPDGNSSITGSSTGTPYLNNPINYYSEPFELIEKYEIGRFITPYGIQLDLGPQGFTWTYDVTDYQWLLHDSVELSAGNQQELIDMEFLLITGTPPREVVNMQRPWGPQKSYSYSSMSDNSQLAPVTVDLDPAATQWAVRSRLTGHGHQSSNGQYPHCCEWKDNTHYFRVNNNDVDNWHIWQTNDCALNPVYPQGGTWPGSREGWCPGDVVKDHWTELTPHVSGATATLDYAITPVPANNLGMGSGNYVVNMDLYEYGASAHTLDAEIYEVKRPSSDDYFRRDNPICYDPVIVLRNAGSTDLTSVTITYGVSGGQSYFHTWNGTLKHMEMVDVHLPIGDASIWNGDGTNRFMVSVSAPNGGADQNPVNDSYTTKFTLPEVYPENFVLYYKTNNRPQENTVTVRGMWDNVVYSRSTFTAATIYADTLNLPTGCYTLEVTDSGNDGLSYWADPNAGNGFFRIKRLNNTFAKTFEPEFGRSLVWAFAVGDVVGLEEATNSFGLSAYPNPTRGTFTLRTSGSHGLAQLEVLDAQGRMVQQRQVQLYGDTRFDVDLSNMGSGLYQIRVTSEGHTEQLRVVKE